MHLEGTKVTEPKLKKAELCMGVFVARLIILGKYSPSSVKI